MGSFFLLSLGLFFSLNQAKAGVTLEGYSDEVLNANRTLLKSVVKFEAGKGMEQYLCSATVVSKNILLTAGHCVLSIEGSTAMKRGDVIAISGKQVRVAAVRSLGAIETTDVINQRSFDTDMALILVESLTPGKPTVIADIAAIPIANQEVASSLSEDILFAGFGMQKRNENKTGEMRAGINKWVVSNYSLPGDEERKLGMEQMVRDNQSDDEQLVTLGKREWSSTENFKKGNSLVPKKPNQNLANGENAAIPLPGDSGSAAIAFDPNHQAYIVGVTSKTGEDAIGTETYYKMTTPSGEEIAYTIPAVISPGIQKQMVQAGLMEFLDQLQAQGWVDSKLVLLKDATFQINKTIYEVGTYASVFTPMNQAFLAKNIGSLEHMRDTHKAPAKKPGAKTPATIKKK